MNNNWDQFQSTPKLLPPTVFEQTTLIESQSNHNNTSITAASAVDIESYGNHHVINNVSQFSLLTSELEKMKLEIKKVHSENENLRIRNKEFVENAKLYTEASGHRQISITALEELIHKQTCELQDMKSQLFIQKEENVAKLKANDTEWTHKQNELLTKLNHADLERRQMIESHEKLITKMQTEYDANNLNNDEKIQSLTHENHQLYEKYNREVKELTKTIEDLTLKHIKDDAISAEEIKSLKNDNSKYVTELQNLKNYVNNSMPTIETVKELTKEKEKFDGEINRMKSLHEGLSKENKTIQIRLKSMNEILSIQENQLETRASCGNEKKRLGLLSKWRTKVYELLIQLKSAGINSKQEKNMTEKIIKEYLERLDDAENKKKIFENVIEDKKAELCVINDVNVTLNDQISTLKETNASLEKKNSDNLQSSLELKIFVDSLMKQYQVIEDSFKIANKKLIHLDQRVEFAKNRLGVVKTLYSRKELTTELKRGNVLEMTTNISSIHGSMDPNESNFNPPISLEHHQQNPLKTVDVERISNHLEAEEENLLRRELDLILEERNILVTKLQGDIDGMSKRSMDLQNDYNKKISSMNEEINGLNEINVIKQKEMSEINEQLLMQTNLCANMTRKYEECHKELLSLREKLSLDYEKQLKKRDMEYGDKMTKLDEKLNEARREQAKAVVIMRQMERSTNREKDRMENLLKSCDTYYKDHLEKLQNKIISLEKERNILINTLRQQGNLPTKEFESLRLSLNQSEVLENKDKSFSMETGFNNDKSLSFSKNDTTEVTSFWLDSKQNIDETADEDDDYVEINSLSKVDEENNLDGSDTHKNSEILQQIRKIMGNLELSDIEDDEKDGKLNETGKDIVDITSDSKYETEHVIDI